jgi:hypothetical protein
MIKYQLSNVKKMRDVKKQPHRPKVGDGAGLEYLSMDTKILVNPPLLIPNSGFFNSSALVSY